MSDTPNLPQEVIDDLLTDPDKDADDTSPPAPPQTVANEPNDERSKR